jgi:hypothetical protein
MSTNGFKGSNEAQPGADQPKNPHRVGRRDARAPGDRRIHPT